MELLNRVKQKAIDAFNGFKQINPVLTTIGQGVKGFIGQSSAASKIAQDPTSTWNGRSYQLPNNDPKYNYVPQNKNEQFGASLNNFLSDLTLGQNDPSFKSGEDILKIIPNIIKASPSLSGLVANVSTKASNLFTPKVAQATEPVIAGTEDVLKKGNLNMMAPAIEDVNWFDKIRLSTAKRLEKALPKEIFGQYDKTIRQPLNESLGVGADWKNIYKDRLNNLGVQAGSVEDKAIRQFVGGNVDRKYLINQFGEDGATKIVNASKELRKTYDEIFDFVNGVRSSSGLDVIKKKKDFLSQMAYGKNSLLDTLGNVTESGMTGGRSTGLFKKQGAEATTGALESFVPYLDTAHQAAFVDPMVPTVRKFAKSLQRAISKNGGDMNVPKFINQYADTLEGVKNKNGFVDVATKVANQIKGSAVIGNPSSLVNQFLNIPQAIAESGPINFVKGFSKDAIKASKESPYLKAIATETPNSLIAGKGKRVINTVGTAMQEANNFTASSIWKGFYEKALQLKEANPIKYADDMAVQLMGDRRIGAAGSFYNSPLGKIMGAFTLENQAGINRLIESIGEKKVGTVVGTLALWHLANNANEKVGTGQRPFFDPIQMTKDIVEQVYGSDRREPNGVKAIGRFVGEATKLTPALQSSLFTAYQISKSLTGGDNSPIPNSRDIFGTEDPTWQNAGSLYNPASNINRRITGNKLVDVPVNLASKVVPGVNPVARATQALFSNSEGVVRSKAGDPMYKAPTDLFNQTRSVLFGQSSTPEAQKYFSNDYNRPMNNKDTKIFDTLSTKGAKTEFLDKTQADTIAKNKVQGYTDSLKSTSSLFGKKAPSEDAIKTDLFNGNDVTVESATARDKVYSAVAKVMNDPNLPQEYKDSVLKASKANAEDVSYYQMASLTVDDRTSAFLDMASTASHDELIQALALNKRRVAGKAVVSSDIWDRMYDEGYISKDDKAMLAALKWDSQGNKFYMDRDFKGGGMSDAQRRSYVNKVNSLYAPRSVKAISTPKVFDTKQINVNLPKLANKRKSTGDWFTRW